jgi:hypothetical protein
MPLAAESLANDWGMYYAVHSLLTLGRLVGWLCIDTNTGLSAIEHWKLNVNIAAWPKSSQD